MVTNMSLFPGAQRCTKAADDADVFTSKLDPPGGGVGEGPEPSKELEGSSGMVYLGKVSKKKIKTCSNSPCNDDADSRTVFLHLEDVK